MSGPTLTVSDLIHSEKYRGPNEDFRAAINRIADGMKDSPEHFHALRDILLDMRFLPAGRVQAAVGSLRKVTPINCFVGRAIEDSMDGIMLAATECAQTLRMGGGWGSDFSTIRPKGDLIRSLQSTSSGPISFMDVFNSVCGTVCSAGHRRGAMMGILRVDHPDILDFIHAKRDQSSLTNFNISVAVTDEFMHAVEADAGFDLKFGGRVHSTVRAVDLWAEIMRSTWDWAEPGIIFIDAVNRLNNLRYCETIASTNPCAEQPLPPFGACLLGSFNLVRYIHRDSKGLYFDEDQFKGDIAAVVRGMDNVIDLAVYPLPQQKHEEIQKRRMGLGVTGAANAIEVLGAPYGSPEFLKVLRSILTILRDTAYRTSVRLADEKGRFPLFDAEKYLQGKFIQTLPADIRDGIRQYGIRNSHLTSIAPTGTISITADNISSGIEPVFAHQYDRTLITPDGPKVYQMQDYGLARFGVRGRTALECTVNDHLAVLCAASQMVDSAVSKTCNVGPDVTWDDFKNVYAVAWREGAKSCSTFRADGKRSGVLKAKEDNKQEPIATLNGGACRVDLATGHRTCDA
jgi:ribonucleoside-diphosphate reductase alpha chain